MGDSLEILIVEGEEPITEALAAALGKRGHRVATAPDVETALSLPTPDVFVCEARTSEACAFDLLHAITQRGTRSRSVLLLSDPTVEDCLRAVRLGARALLTKPFRLAELVHAVEEESRSELQATESRFEWSLPASPDAVERCASELAARCLRRGVPASARARISGAACEIVENVLRHGRLDPGSRIRVRGRFEGPWLRLEIEDDGSGFDPAQAAREVSTGPALSGLARARALSDGFDLRSSPGGGTRVSMRFGVASIAFAEGERDLAEADFLTPRLSREIVLALLEGETPEVTGISPAIAVVLGRLLAGPDPRDLIPERTQDRARLP